VHAGVASPHAGDSSSLFISAANRGSERSRVCMIEGDSTGSEKPLELV
jgi:hypothetical protein